MNIHVICPFYRKHLLTTLIHYLEPMGIIWHPVCDPVDIEPFENNALEWVRPLLCEPLIIGSDQCYRKINDFIDAGGIIDDDYYGFMGDDDMYEPCFFNVLRRQTARIIINSNYRGDTIPDDNAVVKHGAYPLIMSGLKDIFAGNIGFAMYFVKGETLKQTRFGNENGNDDGHYAEMLKARWPGDIVFLPESFVFGNYFQLGRFTSKEAFIKSGWELPELYDARSKT